MKKYGKKSVVVMMLFVLLFSSIYSVNSYAATKKPAQVKKLKVVKNSTKYYEKKKYRSNCQAISSVKISYKKVKGADGYQILIYVRDLLKNLKNSDLLTPIVYAKTTKKTTYTIKQLTPGITYKIKVRAYKKDKNGKITYGKFKTINVKTTGTCKGTYETCNFCAVMVPAGNNMVEHYRAGRDIHGEGTHTGGTFNYY